MKSFSEFLAEEEAKAQPVTREQLSELERYLDAAFANLDIDIAFTKHFFDRINDMRNKVQITVGEVMRLFTKVYKEYGQKIHDAKIGWEAVMHDMSSDINIPFVLNWDSRRNEMQLVNKTIMRKHNFKSSTPFLKVR